MRTAIDLTKVHIKKNKVVNFFLINNVRNFIKKKAKPRPSTLEMYYSGKNQGPRYMVSNFKLLLMDNTTMK